MFKKQKKINVEAYNNLEVITLVVAFRLPKENCSFMTNCSFSFLSKKFSKKMCLAKHFQQFDFASFPHSLPRCKMHLNKFTDKMVTSMILQYPYCPNQSRCHFSGKTEAIAQKTPFWNIDRAVTDHLKVIQVRYFKDKHYYEG